MKDAIEEFARQQNRAIAEKRICEKLGIPDYPCLELQQIKHDHIIPVPPEPRIKVSPYAKFDKIHHKNKHKR